MHALSTLLSPLVLLASVVTANPLPLSNNNTDLYAKHRPLRPTDNSTAHYALTAGNPKKRGNGNEIFYIARCYGDGDNNNYDRGAYYSNWQNSLNLEYPTYTSTWALLLTSYLSWGLTGPEPYDEAYATIWNFDPGWYQIGGRATIETQYDCRMDNSRALYYDNGNPCWSSFHCQ
ncbi:hypothetical protein FRB93_012264 [Tulasnella sp. JGI-2019a]|nr:hypothetical protein FRB93_012264 [Tulasnella sp. JGI-2019a]